jgi:hypothetical protein
MKTTRFMKLDGKQFILPESLTDKEVATLGALVLQLRVSHNVYSSDYETTYTFVSADNVSVSLGTCAPYPSEADARAARDARNAEIEAAKVAKAAAEAAEADARARAEDLHFSQ